MDEALRAFVAERAGHRCEYCLFREDDDVDYFHVEHIIALKHGGGSDESNLAFACQHCNSHKGPCLSGIDPQGKPDEPLRIFNPRRDDWAAHLVFTGPLIDGLTPMGRATVNCLNMNAEQRVAIRALYGYSGFK